MESKETKIEKYMKYFNIFSYLFLKYMWRIDANLLSIYRQAGIDGEAASWYDVFDGVMWICSLIGAIIGHGYLLEVLK